jgi:hypothetical protein
VTWAGGEEVTGTIWCRWTGSVWGLSVPCSLLGDLGEVESPADNRHMCNLDGSDGKEQRKYLVPTNPNAINAMLDLCYASK